MNPNRVQKMRHLLEEALAPSYLQIEDESHKHIGHKGAESGAGHFAVTIQSPLFIGQKLIECHKKIYAVLASMMNTDIHALKIKILFE